MMGIVEHASYGMIDVSAKKKKVQHMSTLRMQLRVVKFN